MEDGTDNLKEVKKGPIPWKELEDKMTQIGKDENLSGKKDATIKNLSEEVKLNLVADSFRFSIGSVRAQALYEIYCAKLMGFTDNNEIAKLFTDIYSSISLESRRKIAGMAPKSHENLESNLDNIGSPDKTLDPMVYQLENCEHYIVNWLSRHSPEVPNTIDYIIHRSRKGEMDSRPSLYAISAYLGAFSRLDGKKHFELPMEKQFEIFNKGKDLVAEANNIDN